MAKCHQNRKKRKQRAKRLINQEVKLFHQMSKAIGRSYPPGTPIVKRPRISKN